MYLATAQGSVLDSAMATASPGTTQLTIIAGSGTSRLPQLQEALALAAKLPGRRWFSAPILTTDLGTEVSTAGSRYLADALARTGICRHLTVSAGRCPGGPGQVMVSGRTAALTGWRLGGAVTADIVGGAPRQLRIVGIYQPPATVNDSYWAGLNYFIFGRGSIIPGSPPPPLDPFFATAATVDRAGGSPQVSAQLVLHPAVAVAAGAVALQDVLKRYQAELYPLGFTYFSSLPSLLAGVRNGSHQMATVVWAVTLQVLLLALIVLSGLMAVMVRDRGLETAIARRRGYTRGALMSLAVGEPGLLILAALPVGFLLATGALAVLATPLFGSGVPVVLGGDSFLVALAAFAGGVAACAVASRPLWQRASAIASGNEPKRPARLAIADTLALTLAATGLLALNGTGSLNGAHSDPVAALAPALIALGAAVIGIRLVSLAVTALTRTSRQSPHVAAFLAVRQLARQPGVIRQSLPLTIATTLTLFAVSAWALAGDNRAAIAAVQVGAAQVVDVRVPAGVDLVTAVRQADPGGHNAMAAAFLQTPSETLLAVDPGRFASVASWPASLSPYSARAVARFLSAATAPPVAFSGDRLTVVVGAPAVPGPIDLEAAVFDETYQVTWEINLGRLRPGTHHYSASLEGACPQVCRLVNLAPDAESSFVAANRPLDMVLREFLVGAGPGVGRVVPFGAAPADWTSAPAGIGSAPAPGGGIQFSFPADLLGSGGVYVAPADVPSLLPEVITGQLAARDNPSPPDHMVAGYGLDGRPLDFEAAVQVPTIPEAGQDATLVSLPLAEDALNGHVADTTYQVWMTAGSPASILGKLRRAGVEPLSTTTSAAVLGQLDHSGLALAYTWLLLASPIAALLALGAIVFSMVATARRRRMDLARLRALGFPARIQQVALLLENGVVLATAFAVGTVAGVGAAAIALTSLPEVSGGTFGLPLSRGLPLNSVAVAAVALGLALAVGTAITSRLVARTVAGPR